MIRQELYKQMRKNHLLLLGMLYVILRSASALFFHVYPIMRRNSSVYDSGSAVFILRQNADWLLIGLTAYCGICIWVKEYSVEMQAFHLTAKHGRASLARIKFILIMLFPMLFSIAASSVELGIDLMRFGSTELSLSSLGVEYTETVRTGMTLHYALLLIPLKAIGITAFSAFISLAALLIKRSLPVLLSALSIILIPIYLFPSSDIRCRLCMPVALMQGKELLRGSISAQNAFGETEYAFREITNYELIRCILVQLLLISICIALCVRLYLQKPLRFRRYLNAISLILCVSLLSGCGSTLPDSVTSKPQFLVCLDRSTIYNKADGTMFSVNPTPLTHYTVAGIYGDYALVSERIPNMAQVFTVCLLHLPDLTKTELLTVGRTANREGLLGLDDLIEVPSSWIFDFDTYGMSPQMQIDGNVLYGKAENGLFSFDLKTGNRTDWLSGESFYSPKMRDGILYYLDTTQTLFRIDTNNQKETVATQVSSYVLCPQSICYISDGIAYRMTEDGSKKQLCDKSVDYFLYCDDTQAVFITQDMQTAAIVGESIQCYDNIFQAADDCCLYREDEEFHVVHYHS